MTRPRRRTRIVFAIAALVVVVVTWLLLPTPAWVRRNHVVDRDYRTMAYIFDADPLPDSFEIREVDYVGYSLVFNGPEGPAYSSYHIVMDARDFLPIRRLLQPFRQKDNRTYMWRPLYSFESGKSFQNAYYESLGNAVPEWYSINRPSRHDPRYQTYSTCIVDTRSSPTVSLYVSTRAYLALD